MPSYVYTARNEMGKRVKGTLEAVSKVELTDRLHKMGYLVTQVEEAFPPIRVEGFLAHVHGVKSEEMAIFNVQLANLIHAGISLLSSLKVLTQQIEGQRLKRAVEGVARAVEAGESFSEALAQSPETFPKLFVDMTRAGEASGKLDEILTRYAAYCESQEELRQKIKGALFYPALLLAAGMGVMLLIVTFIIPKFSEIFLQVGIPLPLPTRILYQIGLYLKSFWYTMIAFVAAGVVGIRYFAGRPSGKFFMDRLILSLPLFGPLSRKASLSRFARTLGMLVASGVPILSSLEIVREITGNEVLRRIVENARGAVEKGEKMSETLRISGEFPPDAVHMIAVGEETGNLDEMLEKISDFYDRSLGYTVKKLTTVIEPLLLCLMGCLVGFIMASMLLPMFDMIKILKH